MKLFRNKRAQWSTFQKFVVAAALIVILLFIAKGQLFGVDNHLNEITRSATSDYDGDRIKDNLDEAPCTFGDMKILAQGKADIYYPVQRPISKDAVAQGITVSPKDICPTKSSETSSEKTCKGVFYEGKPLLCVLDRETEELYCSLSQESCDELLKESYARTK